VPCPGEQGPRIIILIRRQHLIHAGFVGAEHAQRAAAVALLQWGVYRCDPGPPLAPYYVSLCTTSKSAGL
jgi:hypothetical protein